MQFRERNRLVTDLAVKLREVVIKPNVNRVIAASAHAR